MAVQAHRVGEHVAVAGADEALLAGVGVPPVVGAGALQQQRQRQRVRAALDVAMAVGEDEVGHQLLLRADVVELETVIGAGIAFKFCFLPSCSLITNYNFIH